MNFVYGVFSGRVSNDKVKKLISFHKNIRKEGEREEREKKYLTYTWKAKKSHWINNSLKWDIYIF